MAVKCYVINLDRDAHRLGLFQAAAREAGIDVERIVGVLGADLAAAEDVSSYFTFNGELAPQVATALKVGEIGNYASHLRALQRVVADGAPAVILEDDTKLLPGFLELVDEVLAKLPAGWDFVRLSNEPKRAYVAIMPLQRGYELVRYSKVSNSAMAYLVSPAGAQ
jgi:GR25 family glycosyltransferase involved in LPS biosynthesis